MDAVAMYRYDAIRLGDAPTDEGVADNLPLMVRDGVASIGNLSQGRWTFNVRAYSSRVVNDDNTLLYEGTQTMYVGAGANSAKIVLRQHEGSYGKIAIDVTTMKINDGSVPVLTVGWTKYSSSGVGENGSSTSALTSIWTTTEIFDVSGCVNFGTRSWPQSYIDANCIPGNASVEVDNNLGISLSAGQMIYLTVRNTTTNTDGMWYGLVTRGCSTSEKPRVTMTSYVPEPDHIRYTTTSLVAKEGRYRLSLNVGDMYDTIDIMVVGEDTTYVTGTLNPDWFMPTTLEIDGPEKISGHIEANVTPALSTSTTYTWVSDEGSPSQYVWSVNGQYYSNQGSGTMYSTSSSLSFTPPANGIYTIVCVARNAEGEYGHAVYVADVSGSSWKPMGTLVKDYGTGYGVYSVSYDYDAAPVHDIMVLLTDGIGGRYLGFGGTVTGNGTAVSPLITWAPWEGGSLNSSRLGTSQADRTGRANTNLLLSHDSQMTSHTSGSNQVISLGGAYTRLGDPDTHIPSHEEMKYVMNAVNNGTLSLPANSRWWTSSENPNSTGEAYVLYINGSGTASIVTMSKTSTVPGMLYVRLV